MSLGSGAHFEAALSRPCQASHSERHLGCAFHFPFPSRLAHYSAYREDFGGPFEDDTRPARSFRPNTRRGEDETL